MAEPTFFATEAEFRRWLEVNHQTAHELLVGFWKKATGKPSIDWPRARDQALCFGWIDGHRRSLGDEAHTIRFTPRRKGSIWSKVNVERFEALKAAGLMTAAGEAAYERDKHRSGVYSYEKPVAELTREEEALFRGNRNAWADWEKRPASYRRSALGWVTGAKRPKTRAKRLNDLIAISAEGRRLPQYDWQKKS
ncbi:MAG: YdeI/OmpD-associated family protein [Myxococcales bacterium]